MLFLKSLNRIYSVAKKKPNDREMQGETDQQYQAHIQEIV